MLKRNNLVLIPSLQTKATNRCLTYQNYKDRVDPAFEDSNLHQRWKSVKTSYF